MKNAFLFVRNTPFMNRIVRSILRFSITFFSGKLSSVAEKFRPYGKTKIRYSGETFFIYAEADDNIMRSLYYLENWDRNEAFILKLIAQQSRLMFDVGANTGIHSILAATSNPGLKVFSFEPHPTNFARLKKNIALNKLANIEAVQLAVGENAAKIQFTIPADNSISDVSSAVNEFTTAYYQIAYKEIEVEQVDLDTFIEQQNAMPDFIKIDVEFYELSVLKGMKRFLQAYSPILTLEIFVTDFLHATTPVLEGKIDPDYSKKIQQFMQELGYYFYMFCDHGLFRTDSIIESPDHTNYLFVKRKSESKYLLYSSDELTALLKP